jgi:hypothetical protein
MIYFPVHVSHIKSKLRYDRRSVGESVFVSGTHLGPMARFLLLSDSCGSALSDERTRSLELLLGLDSAVIFGSEIRRTHDNVLLLQI